MAHKSDCVCLLYVIHLSLCYIVLHCVTLLMQLKNDIQMMITDYKDMCNEREDLLYSLQDVSSVMEHKSPL